ncbi:MAG TPA: YihY/virulence factor BrkB family protein [Usitatibacter sp.]|jgi:YihY family inner membrane protein|nr:YihY/virulence factor BrkB family protein [Usitatibacter sp.]
MGDRARRAWAFVVRTLKAFKANQGLLLAGAVAYYALLSLIPLFILILLALTHFIGEFEVLEAMRRYLDWLVPGQGATLTVEFARFLAHREVMGPLLFLTMVFFSSLAFTVLENAMSVIFHHRVAIRRRHFAVSALLPYLYITCLGVGMLLVTLMVGSLEAMGERTVLFLGRAWSLGQVSAALLYALGFVGEVLIITALYMVMPVGRLRWRHALVGGATAAVLWEITRHVLLWYFNTLSRVSEVYGSLTTAIVVLLSLELAATLLLLGGQVIAEYERLGTRAQKAPPKAMRTERAA